MKINVHAGHNPDGKIACGASGLIKESTQARKVKDLVIKYLKAAGHTVYDCTCNDGTSQTDVLKKIVAKCNAHSVNLDVSIHFNSGAEDEKGNGKTTGIEVYIASSASKAKDEAKRICRKIVALGFKNRGVKVKNNLYVLNHTKAPALLVECCFVDDKDDAKLYDAEKMAKAIASGITGKATVAPAQTTPKKKETKKMVKVTAKRGLNCRKGAGASYAVICAVPYGTKLEIIQEKGGWGKTIKGWIKLEYTKKV